MSEPNTTETVEIDGKTYEFAYSEFIECEHCEYRWDTRSESRRPTCPNCQRKTDRNVVGKYYENYLKYGLFSGEEESTEEVAGRLDSLAQLFRAMEQNGWEFCQTTGSSHVVFKKGDFDPGEIIA